MKGLTIFEVLVSVLIFSIIAMGLGSAVVAGKSALFVSDIPSQLRRLIRSDIFCSVPRNIIFCACFAFVEMAIGHTAVPIKLS